jgi:hypothetical protein
MSARRNNRRNMVRLRDALRMNRMVTLTCHRLL